MENSKRNALTVERATKPRPTVAQLEAKRKDTLALIAGVCAGIVLYCVLFTIYTFATRWF